MIDLKTTYTLDASSYGKTGPEARYDPAQPWRSLGYPSELMPLIQPQDLWDLARRTGFLVRAPDDIKRWSNDSEIISQGRRKKELGEWLGEQQEARYRQGWERFSAEVRAMKPPVLPEPVRRLLPSQAPERLRELWEVYQRDLLRELWFAVPEIPSLDWRVTCILPPHPLPDPFPVPVSVPPAPDLWLAWSAPSPGGVSEPLLVRSLEVPRPGDMLELRSDVIGWGVGALVTGNPVALDRPDAAAIIEAVHHDQRGLWTEVATGSR